MSETPPAPGSQTARGLSPTSGSKRPWTILGRLSQAVREQNWFAVGLEVVIVMLGVVIGFQVTAWGQARSDAAREQTYLVQLKADLVATQQVVTRADSLLVLPERASERLVRAFYADEPPPLDTVNVWLFTAYEYDVARPVLGTAKALVSTGDLNLLRNDTLRSAITAYIDRNEMVVRYQESIFELTYASTRMLHRRFDFASTLASVFLPATLDSLAQAWEPVFVPVGLDRPPRSIDVDRFFRDDEIRALLLEINVAQRNQRNHRDEMRALADALLAQIEAELSR